MDAIESVFAANTERTIKGRVGTALPGSDVLVHPSGGDGPIVAKASKPLTSQIEGLPLSVTIQRNANDEVSLTNISPYFVTSWNQSDLPGVLTANVKPLVDDLEKRFQEYAESASAGRKELRDIVASSEKMQEALLISYQSTPSDDLKTLSVLSKVNRDIVDFQLKAQIGHDDNYWPEVYQKMYFHSRSVVAITLKGRTESIGTGTLIGENLIITCRHVFSEAFTDYEVWFDYEDTSSGRLEKRAFPVQGVEFEGGVAAGLGINPLDVALVRLGPDANGLNCATRGYVPLPLTTAPSVIYDPVYVIGHPRGSVRTIHDNARIHFPFQLSGLRKTNLDAQVRHEIELFTSTKFGPGLQRDQLVKDLYADYEASFVRSGSNFRYVHRLRGPAIGIDSDTYGGDSGAPACLRRGSGKAAGLIGIFVGGTTESAASASWLSHEVVLPITEVIAQLDAEDLNWTAKYKVDLKRV